MTCCHLRYCLISLAVLQLVLSVERLIFDFLAYLWLPIFMTFIELVALIFGLFGAFQLRLSYLVLFCSWSVVWLIWNVFLICFFLGAQSFDKAEELLSLYTGGTSFWQTGGVGCRPVYLNNGTAPGPRDPYQRPRPDRVDGCWLPYQHVEAAHSGAQLLLTVTATSLALAVLIRRRQHLKTEKVKSRSLSPSFHIEYRTHRAASPDSGGAEGAGAALPAPMTPRKIKRRSMSRSSHRSSGRSSRSAAHRASQRSRRHANPVAQLMDSSSSEAPGPAPLATLSGRVNPSFQSTEWAPPRPPSVHSSYSNYHGQRQLVPASYGPAGRRLGGVGPPPYSSTPSLNETAM